MKRSVLVAVCLLFVSGCATTGAGIVKNVPTRMFQARVPLYNMQKYPAEVMIRAVAEGLDVSSSGEIKLVLPAPVVGGKLETYPGKYFGKMLFQ